MSEFRAEIQARLDLSHIPEDIRRIEQNRVTLGVDTNNFRNEMRNVNSDVSRHLNQSMASITTTIRNSQSAIQGMQRTLASANFDKSSIGKVTHDLQTMNLAISEIGTSIRGNALTLNIKGIDEFQRAITVTRQFNQETGEITETSRRIVQAFDTGAEAARKYENALAKIAQGEPFKQLEQYQRQFEKLSTFTGGLKATEDTRILVDQLQAASAHLTELGSLQEMMSSGRLSTEGLVNTYERFNIVLSSVKNELSIAATESKQFATETEVFTLKGKMEAWLQKNTKAFKEFGGEVQKLIDELNGLNGQGNVYKTDTSRIADEFKKIDLAAEAAGKKGQSFGTAFKGAFESITRYVSTATLIYKTVEAMREMVRTAIEIDDAMTQLKIVTGATGEELNRTFNVSVGLAKELGKNVTDIIKAIETFSRLGYTLTESTELAKFTGILSNTANVSVDNATTGLTAIIKGYQKQVGEAEHISDVLIKVGQELPVSAQELITAYEKAGAALSATNTSFEKSAGLIAAGNAATQNADAVGTALKTISARIRSSRTELQELGESTDDLVDGFSKYAKEIQALTGFNIMVEGTTDEFKDLYDIMAGINEVWDNLSGTQQARVAEILGGTRQYQIVASIMNNWGDAVKGYEAALNSAGTATQANDIYMQSITAHIEQFKAAFAELSADLMNSTFLKGVIDLGTGFLTLLDKLTGSIGMLGTVLVGAGIVKGITSIASL